MKQVIRTEVTEKDGFPSLSYMVDHKALEEISKRRLGKTVLFTDNDSWTNEEIILAYEAYDLHLPNNKDGWLGFDDWDITAMTHIKMGIKPLETDSITRVVPLKADTKSVTIEADFIFIYEDGESAVLKKVSKNITF